MRQLKKKEASPRRMMLRIGVATVATIVGVISIALSIHYMKLGMVSHPSPSDMGFVLIWASLTISGICCISPVIATRFIQCCFGQLVEPLCYMQYS